MQCIVMDQYLLFDDWMILCLPCRYNESGQYAKDQQAAAAADTPGASGSGHYMDANNLMGAVAPEPKAKWAPPNGMSFKEYKEYKKRLKMKRNGVF